MWGRHEKGWPAHSVQKCIPCVSSGQPGVEVEQPTETSAALDGVRGGVVVARGRLWVNESAVRCAIIALLAALP